MLPFFLLLSLTRFAAQAQTLPGVIGNFTDGRQSVRFVASTPNFYLEPGESIHPALATGFRGEWTGELQVLANAEFEFIPPVTLDGKSGAKHLLAAGTHRLTIPYSRPDGIAKMRLQWRSAGFDWEPVPPSALSHKAAVDPGNQAELGRLLIWEARCANCHRATGLDHSAPSFEGIGSRTNRNWIYDFLRRHEVVPHTDQQSAHLAAHLSTQRSTVAVKNRRANEVAIGKGGELLGTLGCIQCHPSGSLQGLGSKYNLNVLTNLVLTTHRPGMLLTDEDAVALAAYLTRSTGTIAEAPAGNAEEGARLIATLGCAGCHAGKAFVKPLDQVKSDACPKVKTPWNPAQRTAVRAFLNAPPKQSPAPVFDFRFQLARHQCLACHKPGSEAPTLDGVGEKLKTSWIGEVLWAKKRIRPGREMRMPHFDEAEWQPWVASFAKMEGIAPGDGAKPPEFASERRATGIGLLGTNARKKGMACIGCHDWGTYKSLGEEGPQIINATARMRFEWFERWMRDPARILSGTSMPNYFGSMPADRARDGIHTLWAGLELGAKAPVPDGYRTSDLEVSGEARPIPGKEAIVLRWDMPEATPAAIAVGLPGGKLSYCFDAGESRLLYAWQGGFLDMTGTLLRKTDEKKTTPTATLVGKIIWHTKEYPILIGVDKRVPQRRFKGYRLIAGIPEFHYLIDGIDVYERLSPAADGIVREVTISKVDQPMFFEGQPVARGTNVKLTARIPQ